MYVLNRSLGIILLIIAMAGSALASSPKDILLSIENENLQDFCNNWYGTKYKGGGCSKTGIDCSCFARTLYKHVYDTDLDRSSAMQCQQSKAIKKIRKLKEGDLVFFKIKSLKVNHVGVYLGDRKFIHATTSNGVIVSSLDETYYKNYYHRGGRVGH